MAATGAAASSSAAAAVNAPSVLDRICTLAIRTMDDLIDILQKLVGNIDMYGGMYDLLVVDSMLDIWQLYDRSERHEGSCILFDVFCRLFFF